MLPLWARVDLGVMAMKEYFAFPKAPVLLEPQHEIVECHMQDIQGGALYPSAEVQLVYSTVPTDWAIQKWSFTIRCCLVSHQRQPMVSVCGFKGHPIKFKSYSKGIQLNSHQIRLREKKRILKVNPYQLLIVC